MADITIILTVADGNESFSVWEALQRFFFFDQALYIGANKRK
jgi:hypothetical protein